jgi:hypothetical protein
MYARQSRMLKSFERPGFSKDSRLLFSTRVPQFFESKQFLIVLLILYEIEGAKFPSSEHAHHNISPPYNRSS